MLNSSNADRSPVADPPRPGYASYLASAAWRGSPARWAEFAASGRRCRLCDRSPPEVTLEAHHRTYERLGRELAGDLTTLCGECHVGVTAMLRTRRYALRAPPPPRDVRAPWRRLLATTGWLDARP